MSKLVQQWFQLARKDLNHAKFNWEHQNKNDCKELVAFLCQQSVEKSIKGVLQFKSIKIEKTHDLTKLSTMLLNLYPEHELLLSEAVLLTPFAVSYRYPDAIDKDLSIHIVENALETTKNVYREMTLIIPFKGTLE